MIGRRGFLKAIGVGVLGLSLALRRPEPAIDVAPIEDRSTGMAVRFIRNWDAVQSQQVNRFDVLYGVGKMRPEFAVRVTDAPSWLERLLSSWRAA